MTENPTTQSAPEPLPKEEVLSTMQELAELPPGQNGVGLFSRQEE